MGDELYASSCVYCPHQECKVHHEQASSFALTCQMRSCRSFDTKAGEWHDVQLPFEEFIPLFRAKTVKDGAKLDPSTVTSVQVCIPSFWFCF